MFLLYSLCLLRCALLRFKKIWLFVKNKYFVKYLADLTTFLKESISIPSHLLWLVLLHQVLSNTILANDNFVSSGIPQFVHISYICIVKKNIFLVFVASLLFGFNNNLYECSLPNNIALVLLNLACFLSIWFMRSAISSCCRVLSIVYCFLYRA